MLTHIIHRTAVVAVAASLAVSMPGCGATRTVGDLAHAEQVAASCPTDGSKIAALVASDESGSRHGATGHPAEQQVLRDVTERTTICGGHLRVTLFSGSMIGTTIFDGDLHLEGATINARLRKAPKVVESVMNEINAALPPATAQLSGGATDIVGQYQHGAEYQAQLSVTGSVHLEQTILTDGIQTAGQDLGDLALSPEQAEALAATFTVPDLAGATVRLTGLGRQADGTPLPTPFIRALRTFHAKICERTGAHCTVVTDAAGT